MGNRSRLALVLFALVMSAPAYAGFDVQLTPPSFLMASALTSVEPPETSLRPTDATYSRNGASKTDAWCIVRQPSGRETIEQMTCAAFLQSVERGIELKAAKGWNSIFLQVYAVGALIGAPLTIDLLHDDLNFGDSALLTLGNAVGTHLAVLGYAGVVGGAGMATLWLLANLFFLDPDADWIIAAVIAGGLGLGLVLAAPFVFSWTHGDHDPEPSKTLAVGSTAVSLVTATAGFFLLEDVNASTSAKLLAVSATCLLAVSVNYALFRKGPSDTPPMMIASPLMTF